MGEFLMPSLGADMEAGTILEWRVHPGDDVHRGDIVAVVDTEKADIEVEVFEDGVIDELLVEVGRQVPVGTPLARITSSSVTSLAAPAAPALVEAAPAPAPAPPPAPARAPKRRAAAARPARQQPAVSVGDHVRASPLARRRAAEAGIELAGRRGSGPDGAIVAADVAAGVTAGVVQTAEPDEAERGAARHASRQQSMRAAIGDLMARSKREIPHYYLATTIDLAASIEWLTEQNRTRPVSERLLPAALLLKATALAAKEVPALNGFWQDEFRGAGQVHLGVAVSLRGGGLIAPAIHDADLLTVDAMMEALRDLVARARSGRLRSSEMSDPTMTVTSLGEQGADEVFGVIYPPQVALVGFGRVAQRPWAVNGMLTVRPTVRATLSADHRATDGHEGSRLLAVIDRLLQRPEDL